MTKLTCDLRRDVINSFTVGGASLSVGRKLEEVRRTEK